jgi:predicted nucleotidyltransferase
MVPESIVAEATRRLVRFFEPERVYLFGSSARRQAGADSDLDFLVVLPDGAPKRLYRANGLYAELWGLGAAVDVVRWPASDFEERAKHVEASLPATVMREGRLLYDSRLAAA